MNKMKTYLLPFIFVACLLIGGCSEDDTDEVKTMAELNIVIANDDTYKFVVTVAGEGNALITKQASNFEVSEFKKDTVTQNGVYTFKPRKDYVGVEVVELEKHTYLYDSEPSTKKERIKLFISVEKAALQNQ